MTDKADMIRAGLRKEMLREYPDSTLVDLTYMGFGALSSITEMLVSDDEKTRQRGKARIEQIISIASQ